ncbi:Hypothetical predicted protein, partial [Paramuricea clavata]
MDFSYFTIDVLSSDEAEIEKAFPIAFCDEKNVEVRIGKSSSETTECSLETLTSDQKIATTDAQTIFKFKKPKGKPKKARKLRKKKVILANIRDLAKDALLQMKKNEMLNALYRHQISRLLEKPLPAFPSDDLKERLEKTCTKFSSRFITTAREAMWEEFNKIWTDENITKSIIDARGITSDFCSWFLFYLQQAVAKTYLQCDSTALVNDLDLSDAEQESVAYIAGAVLKNVGSKLCELKWKIASNGQDVATVDKDITILNACKET